MEDWHFHLSTLFPEIRPKEFFEIRSPDMIAIGDLAAPLVFVSGLVYDDDAAMKARRLLPDPSESLLRVAGKEGLANESVRSKARELVEIAIEGAGRLPRDYLSAVHLESAREWLTARMA